MSILSNIQSYLSGKSKARRDIALAEMFFEEHKGDPPREIARKFFTSLGEDVSRTDRIELATYDRAAHKYEHEWLINLQREMDAERQQAMAEILQQVVPGILVAMTPSMTEEEINEIAKEHGHDTREDECMAIQLLRERLQREQDQQD